MSELPSISYRVRGSDQREYGPVDFTTLERWTREARVTKGTAVWSQTDNQWRAAGERRELDAAFATWLEAGAPPIIGPPVNAQAIWSFVLAQFGLCCGFFGIPAVICGFISLSQIRKRRERGRALAVSGIILGFAGLALGVLTLLYLWLMANLPPEVLQEVIPPELRPMLEPLLRPR
ncbi:MAG: DUF4190 domain-containing protein [Verrucomicrobia bacterium]|nr:DUF4190 domain-containing protein [Verrucomicrobiota bacterium]